MSIRPSLLAATALMAAAVCAGVHAADTQTENINVLERRTFSYSQIYARGILPRSTTHELRLTLAYFAGSSWQQDALLDIAGRAAGILAQCGVLVSQIEIARIDAPQHYHYFATLVSRELAFALQLPKPTAYFVSDTRQQPAFDAEAIGRGNSRTRPELADTVWITRTARDPGIVLAHELAHVLMDSGEHVEEPENLMRTRTTAENTRLSPAQCGRLRATGTGNGLLHPVKN
ncbi:MAG: hypothetical protein AABZ67_13855 [Pseudomonadota bacterium]